MERFLKILTSFCGMAHVLAISLVGASDDLLGDFADLVPWAHTVLLRLRVPPGFS